ncbi:mitotic-spindle organizing protein 2B isoform X1 [Saimiri boliviensis]|uniref:mitotic-spindle organizing protein 2B isoform X1 n=1 Tax=Saimiri boliviensis TaxID=27679 RepID=UPI003D783C4F
MPPPTPSTPPSTPRAPNNCCARVTVRGGGSVPASRPRRPRAGAAGRGWRAPPPADAGAAGRGGADGGAGRRAGARVGGAARAGGGPAEAGAAAEEGAERRGDGALRTGAGGGQRHRPRCVQMLKSMCAGQRLANEPQDPAAVSLPTSSEPETREASFLSARNSSPPGRPSFSSGLQPAASPVLLHSLAATHSPLSPGPLGSLRLSCCLFSPFAGCLYWLILGGWCSPLFPWKLPGPKR